MLKTFILHAQIYSALTALSAHDMEVLSAVLSGAACVWVGSGFVPASRVAFRRAHGPFGKHPNRDNSNPVAPTSGSTLLWKPGDHAFEGVGEPLEVLIDMLCAHASAGGP